MPRRATPDRGATRRRAAWALALCIAIVTARPAPATDGTAAPPTAAPTSAPIALAEVSQRSDAVAVYLREVEERVRPGEEIASTERELPVLAERLRALGVHTTQALSASASLRDVDELLAQWQGMQDSLAEWAKTVSGKLTVIDAELGGLGDLRGIWQATREAAQAASAPPALLDRIRTTLGSIEQSRKLIEEFRGRLLVLQDRIVQESARGRDATDQLTSYRRAAVGRLLVRDGQPIWASVPWRVDTDAAAAAYRSQIESLSQIATDYLSLQLPRVPLHLVLFVFLVFVWRQARQRTKRWLREDDSLASVAAVFEHPLSAALFLSLLIAPWFYPQLPVLFRIGIRIAAVPPLLRVLDRLVGRPILPGLYALGAFFITDQLRMLLGPLPRLEQLVFLLEMLAGIGVLVWLLRSGRLAGLRAEHSPRAVAVLERGAVLVVVLLGTALLAAVFGFLQLGRVIAGAVLGSGYAAMLLFAVQRVAQGVWAYLLRTATLRQLRMVQRHRPLLQERGEWALSWTAVALWIIATLAGLELLAPTRTALYGALTATLAVGELSISFGDVLALAVTIWIAFLLSRFLRFVLEEEVYPRVQLPRGMPYALATLVHYFVLLTGFLIGLSAAGLKLDRFALLAGAFGVGVGFGLQTIVNNFVSGLILLFERPLQVGDTVQIGNVYGEIRRIGIRASVVRTFEGAEVIVPNGTLIADPVTNWTLTDRMRRIDVPVSVAYGSDPERVLEVLRAVAVGHSLIVDAPAPSAIFMGFGESALTFELRAWTDRAERWVQVRSELGIAVFKALTGAGIAIPVAPREAFRGSDPGAAPAGGGAPEH